MNDSPITVNVDIRTDDPVTEDDILALEGDEHGTAVAAHLGGHQFNATLNIGYDLYSACHEAIEYVTKHVPGTPVAVAATTNEEFDRWLDQPSFPPLAGVSEIAELLGVSRQRVAELRRRPDFPGPVAQLKAGPVWRAGDLSRFADEWQRKPGRPRKPTIEIDGVDVADEVVNFSEVLEERVAATKRHPAGTAKRSTASKKHNATG